jgi:hypothetical protein
MVPGGTSRRVAAVHQFRLPVAALSKLKPTQ